MLILPAPPRYSEMCHVLFLPLALRLSRLTPADNLRRGSAFWFIGWLVCSPLRSPEQRLA
jgi:hypothetical protein